MGDELWCCDGDCNVDCGNGVVVFDGEVVDKRCGGDSEAVVVVVIVVDVIMVLVVLVVVLLMFGDNPVVYLFVCACVVNSNGSAGIIHGYGSGIGGGIDIEGAGIGG